MLVLILVTMLAGLTIPTGALLAMIERVRPRWLEQALRHSVIAFGGGVLLAAVALVLIPDGSEALPAWVAGGVCVGGGALFLWIDTVAKRRRGSVGRVIAMLADSGPEAISLGAVFVIDRRRAMLLALLIGLRNPP